MTKKEIIESIENNKNVWGVSHNRMYELKAENIEEIGKEEIKYLEYNENYHLNLEIDLLDIYKTKAEAEHYLHHANVTRTEQLPFYTFSEIAKDEKNFKMGKTYTLIEDKNFVLDINKSYVSQIVLYTGKEKYSWNFNEENFYKAYDECVRLFKGE